MRLNVQRCAAGVQDMADLSRRLVPNSDSTGRKMATPFVTNVTSAAMEPGRMNSTGASQGNDVTRFPPSVTSKSQSTAWASRSISIGQIFGRPGQRVVRRLIFPELLNGCPVECGRGWTKPSEGNPGVSAVSECEAEYFPAEAPCICLRNEGPSRS